MKTYIVVEREENKQLLELLLPEYLKSQVVIAPTGNAYSAQTLASSMLATRHNPVALLINARTDDKNIIDQRRAYLMQYLGSNLYAADSDYIVLIAVPEMEIILVHDKESLELLLRRPLAEDELLKAQAGLLTFIQAVEINTLKTGLTPAAIEKARQHPLMVELSTFIRKHIAEKQPS